MRLVLVAIVCGLAATTAHAQVFKPRGKAPPAGTATPATTPATATPAAKPPAKAPAKKASVVAAKKKAPPAKARTVAKHTTVRDDDADPADVDEAPAPRTKKKSGIAIAKHTSVKDDEAADDDSDDFSIVDD